LAKGRGHGKRRRKSGSRKRRVSGPVTYELDRFSLHDLRSWKKANASIAQYHTRVYYELEAQRQIYRKELLAGLRDARVQEFEVERWVRMVDYRYSTQPLSAAGSIRSIGGRFNFGEGLNRKLSPFHGLYIAEDPETATLEFFGGSRNGLTAEELALTPRKSYASICLSGTLSNVLDITDSRNLKSFCEAYRHFRINPEYKKLLAGTKIAPLSIATDPKNLLMTIQSQNWKEFGAQLGIPSNSQVFGQLAFEAGYDGIIYSSTRGPGRCACILVENLQHSETSISIADPIPTSETIQTLDSSTWPKLIAPTSLGKLAARALRRLVN
jgi:hypothetical protein